MTLRQQASTCAQREQVRVGSMRAFDTIAWGRCFLRDVAYLERRFALEHAQHSRDVLDLARPLHVPTDSDNIRISMRERELM